MYLLISAKLVLSVQVKYPAKIRNAILILFSYIQFSQLKLHCILRVIFADNMLEYNADKRGFTVRKEIGQGSGD